MDVTPEHEAPRVSAYPRSAVEEFLASGELEARRLEQAIADARVRAERATFATARAEAIAEMLHSILQDLRREFADRRLQVEAQAEGMVTAAHQEAAQLLAVARRDALPSPSAAHEPVEPPPGDAPVPAPTYRWVATHEAAGAEPEPEPTYAPFTVGVPEQPTPAAAKAVEPPALAPVGLATVAPTRVPPPAPPLDDGADTGNGWHPAPAPTDAAEDGTSTIDLTAGGPERRRAGLGSRLRRSRRRDVVPETDENDEFLDYLRGALVDDAPLSSDADRDPSVDWRWTS